MTLFFQTCSRQVVIHQRETLLPEKLPRGPKITAIPARTLRLTRGWRETTDGGCLTGTGEATSQSPWWELILDVNVCLYKEQYLRSQGRDSVPRCWFQPVCLSAVKPLQSLLEECRHTRNTHPRTETEIEERGYYTFVFAYLFWNCFANQSPKNTKYTTIQKLKG